MCGYRIWGLAAGFIGYFLTFYLIGLLGLDINSEDKKTIGFLVGLGIYLVPLILSSLSKRVLSTPTMLMPVLTDADIEKIKPFTTELIQRANAGEKMEMVAQSIATRAAVSPSQVIAFASALAQAFKEKKQ